MNFKLVLVLTILQQVHAHWKNSCDIRDTVDITGGKKDESENYLWNGIIFPPGTYGETSNSDKGPSEIRGCICKFKPCIRTCEKNDFNNFTLNSPTGDIEVNLANYAVLTGSTCLEFFELNIADYEDDHWEVLKNGSFVYENTTVDYNNYCFDINGEHGTIVMCFGDNPDTVSEYWNIVGFTISIPFLIATLFVYLKVKELNVNLHGKCLMCYITNLTFLFVSLIIVKVLSVAGIDESICTGLAYLSYFCTIITFSWLTIMSFDIWQSHSVFQHGITIIPRKEQQKRFFRYCFYGYGCPILIMLLVFLIDTTKILSEKYLPGLGSRECFIQDGTFAMAMYVRVPIALVVISNIVFFSLTAIKIWWTQHYQQYARIEAEKSKFFIFLQLFIIMGMTWVMEVVPWMFNLQSSTIFRLFDFLNCVQGLIIFLICVCNSRVRNLIKSKWCLSINANRGVSSVSSTVRETTIGMK